MNSAYTTPLYGANSLGYQTVETLLEDVSRQMASSNLVKYSRGSNGQGTGAGSMRIVKPNSASNSPRGSIGLGRRRTEMTDRRRMADPSVATSGAFVSHDGLRVPIRSSRPVSWHPSSQMAAQINYPSNYKIPILNTQSDFHNFNLTPTPVVYPGYGSPDSNFSPNLIHYNGCGQQYSQPGYRIDYQSADTAHTVNQQPTAAPYTSLQQSNRDPAMYSHFDWSNYAPNSFEGSTSPATPETFLPIQHPDTVKPADDVIPYHSLSESEPEGEVLQGLGLYDTPEISKPANSDPQLDNYRSLVISQLLGTSYRKIETESMGKGLKLEETWAPPSDEDDDEDDDEQDGEGEDEDEPLGGDASMLLAANHVPHYQANQGLHYNGGSWL